MTDDIIAAVATAWGESAISVIRASGHGAVALAERFFEGVRPISSEPPRRMALGRLVDDGVTVDQVLAVRFEAGASYTGEESVEIHCHGGTAAARRCMDMFVRAGARVALPGEFTKRAFLSGRIDLAQAEAVLGVIRASGDAALVAANRSLQGDLSARLRNLAGGLTALRAEVEVRLDYPEEVEPEEAAAVSGTLARLRGEASALLERCRTGVVLKNGVRVAIAGRPNAGKSSLLNALLGEERAIVTDIPGTTRDTVEASLVHRGLLVRFVDTAGLREPGDAIERMGMARARAALRGADLCLFVADAASDISDADRDVAHLLRERPTLLVLNKADLPSALPDEAWTSLGGFLGALRVSARSGTGVAALKDAVYDFALGNRPVAAAYAAGERMIEVLTLVQNCMDEAVRVLACDMGVDIAGSLLADASGAIGALLGTDASEELLDAIFSNFCVGK